jgi:hypothetical protein
MHPLRQINIRNTQGEHMPVAGAAYPFQRDTYMTKEEALAAIKLLSAMESWAFSVSSSMKSAIPDYLHEDLCRSMKVLERIVLGEKS